MRKHAKDVIKNADAEAQNYKLCRPGVKKVKHAQTSHRSEDTEPQGPSSEERDLRIENTLKDEIFNVLRDIKVNNTHTHNLNCH